jgi:HSP20 family protein
MNRMQWEMDNIFNQAFTPFRGLPEFDGFFNQARFGASFDLQDEGAKYVLRAYLPNRDNSKVNVTVQDQNLKVEASGEDTQKGNNGDVVSTRKAQYAQVLTLPGPVQADKMTIDRKDDMLVVTLPKKT